jgi:hypothetical protein
LYVRKNRGVASESHRLPKEILVRTYLKSTFAVAALAGATLLPAAGDQG